jgi:hypothetical protein
MKKIVWVVLIGAGLWLGYRFLNQPAVGKINYQQVSVIPTGMEYIRYDGQGLSFAYENKYELRGQEGNWELVGKAGVMSQVVITLGEAKSNDIEEVSGVQMRRVKTADYIEDKIDWKGTEGVVFKKVEGFEETAFFLKNGKAITVAMTANSNDEEILNAEFQKLVESMELK